VQKPYNHFPIQEALANGISAAYVFVLCTPFTKSSSNDQMKERERKI
jgi:hypothetical protein